LLAEVTVSQERKGKAVGILAWIVVGLIAGWLASRVMRGAGYGLIGDIIVGIVGALIGGFLAEKLLGMQSAVNGINIPSIFVAFVGAVILIAILRLVGGRRRYSQSEPLNPRSATRHFTNLEGIYV
jgi:uncharacterized membrane protein YeaQ/YmgE (transglycosylase-associated protein family)